MSQFKEVKALLAYLVSLSWQSNGKVTGSYTPVGSNTINFSKTFLTTHSLVYQTSPIYSIY